MRSVVSAFVGVVAVKGLAVPNNTEVVPQNGDDVRANGHCACQTTPETYWVGTSVQCRSANCDSPRFYVVADANKKMNVWTTNDAESALNGKGGYNWWDDYVTREIYDADMDMVTQTKHSCDGADSELSAWLRRAKEVHSCKYPGGTWEHVFGVDNPKATHTYEVSISNGYTRGQSNSFTQTVKNMSSKVSKDVFTKSNETSYSYEVANSQTWSQAITVKNSITVNPGKSVHSWQWKLSCMGFNDYGTFTEKVTFGTNIYTDTEKFQRPTCLPQDCNSFAVIENQTSTMLV